MIAVGGVALAAIVLEAVASGLGWLWAWAYVGRFGGVQ